MSADSDTFDFVFRAGDISFREMPRVDFSWVRDFFEGTTGGAVEEQELSRFLEKVLETAEAAGGLDLSTSAADAAREIVAAADPDTDWLGSDEAGEIEALLESLGLTWAHSGSGGDAAAEADRGSDWPTGDLEAGMERLLQDLGASVGQANAAWTSTLDSASAGLEWAGPTSSLPWQDEIQHETRVLNPSYDFTRLDELKDLGIQPSFSELFL